MSSERLCRPLRVVSLALLIGLLLGVAGSQAHVPPAHANAIAGVVPGQFIAKIYTEALGRAPTQAEWQSWAVTFGNSLDCEQAVKDAVHDFYTSAAFFQRYPDEAAGRDRDAQLLALSRGALTEEIVQKWYDYYMAEPWVSQQFTATVNDFLLNTRAGLFNSVVHNVCDVGIPPWYDNAPYYWRDPPVVTPRAKGPYSTDPWVFCGAFCAETGADLQRLLNDAANTPTKTVYLAQKAVVRITDTLTLPAGVTLTTWQEDNSPPLSPERYALMGRLVRAFTGEAPVVRQETCSTLQGVWVDGQQAQLHFKRPRAAGAVNVLIWDTAVPSGCQTRLVANRLTDSFGWTQAVAMGNAETGSPCGDVYIGHNLLTGYANSHRPQVQLADGLSIACEHTRVEENQLVDVTDVGIVVFRAAAEGPQHQQTLVRGNVILNAGNSAYGGLVADPGAEPPPCTFTTTRDFSGTLFQDNVLWTGPQAHVDAVLVAGTYAWPFACPHNKGTGVAFVGNTTGDRETCPACTVRTNSPVIVSGMLEALVQCNDLQVEIANTIACYYPGQNNPLGDFIVLADAVTTSASFREPVPPHTLVPFRECVRHLADPTPPPYPTPLLQPCPTGGSGPPPGCGGTAKPFTAGVANGGLEAGLPPAVTISAGWPWPVVCDWANPGSDCWPNGGAYPMPQRGARTGTWAAWPGRYDRAYDVWFHLGEAHAVR